MTARGFAPLLQFAYTAKLVLDRENIHEVMLCADLLGVHNLEDSCFQFLQAQLQNDGQDVNNGEVEYSDEDTVFSEDVCSSEMKQRPGDGDDAPPPAEPPGCPKSWKYQVCDDKRTDESQHASPSLVGSEPEDGGAASQTLLTPSRIKEEPFLFEGAAHERNGSNPEFGTEEVLEMELEVEGVPVLAEPSAGCQDLTSSCLRSYLQQGGLDLNNMSSRTIQELLTNRLWSKGDFLSQADFKTNHRDMDWSKTSSCQQDGELDRCSVIFSAAGDRHSSSARPYVDEKIQDDVSTLMQEETPPSGPTSLSICPVAINSPAPSEPRTQSSSSCSSVSYPDEAANGSSLSSLPFDLASFEHPPRSLVQMVEARTPLSRELVFSQDCTKVKSEQGFGTSGGNSSDESDSFSEGDSEGGARVSAPEVSAVLHLCFLCWR